MSRNNKSGGFNKFLNFIGIVDDNRYPEQPAQSFNSGSSYGQPEAYTPSSRQRTEARTSGAGSARRSIPAQGSRSNTGSRRVYEDDRRYASSRPSSRFDEEPQQAYASQPRSRSRFNSDEDSMQDRAAASSRNAAPAQRPAQRSSGQTVACTLYTLTDVNPVIKALIRGDSILINLNAGDDHMERRILDTLSGAVFALDAQFRQPNKSFKTYIIAPKSVNIQTLQDLDD